MRKTLITGAALGTILLLSIFTILPAHVIDGDLVWGKEFFKWMMLLGLISSAIGIFRSNDFSGVSISLLGAFMSGLAFWSLYYDLPPNDVVAFAAKSLLALIGYLGSLMILIFFPVLFEKG